MEGTGLTGRASVLGPPCLLDGLPARGPPLGTSRGLASVLLPTPSPSFPRAFCSLPFQKSPRAMIRLDCVFGFGLRKIKDLRLVRPCIKSLIISFKALSYVKPGESTPGFQTGQVLSPEKTLRPGR